MGIYHVIVLISMVVNIKAFIFIEDMIIIYSFSFSSRTYCQFCLSTCCFFNMVAKIRMSKTKPLEFL